MYYLFSIGFVVFHVVGCYLLYYVFFSFCLSLLIYFVFVPYACRYFVLHCVMIMCFFFSFILYQLLSFFILFALSLVCYTSLLVL